ncbi:MAG TPA: PHP domain-containing protein [Eubacteriales bacterium]|nr:PHP domain-containing protein [Clostridia bacterium]HRV73731.1 PHP domain-containing protein [Eubacteriales bacterium]
MTAFPCDLHVHSCLSPCAEDDMTPCNIAGMAYLNGLAMVALTDHNSTRNCPAFFRACEEYGITPVAGMELTTSEDIHLLCVMPDLETAERFESVVAPRRMRIPNRPDIYGMQQVMGAEDVPIDTEPYFLPAAADIALEEAVGIVSELGGVCWPAHIDREANGILAILGAFPDEPEFKACELHDAKNAELAEGRYCLVSSDAHRLWEIADGSFSVELPECSAKALIERIKEL